MMSCKTCIRLIFFYILLISDPTTAWSQDIVGSWENELGSVLVVDSISVEGFIYGKYKSSSGVDGRIFPLQGWINSPQESSSVAISFTVRWDGYGSITSWSGYLDIDDDGPFIKTLWYLVRPNAKEPWERIISNSSLFLPVQD